MNKKTLAILEIIRNEMDSIPGHTGFYYLNLVNGDEFGVREDEVFGAASVIKLPLFLHILHQCHAGRMRMEERLTAAEADKVPICGALTLFTGPVEADIRTLCRLMISLSDNTATNLLIERAGLAEAADGFRSMGLAKTQLKRRLFDAKAAQAGLQNVICPREIGMLLQQLHEGSFVSEDVCREALDVLLMQQVDHKLNGKICGAIPIAHKTGEDDGISNDVGIVYAAQPFVICFAGCETDVYAWEDLMRQGTYELWQALEP
jgi:beta-lactamase class A